MANADPFSEADRRAVASQLGRFLSVPRTTLEAANLAPPSGPKLTESLAVCVLPATAVTDPPPDLLALVQPGGLWHHQVRTSDGPTHAARSVREGFANAQPEVQMFGPQPLAAKVDEAIAWVDAHIPDEGAVVRLLAIPTYYVHALVVIRGKRLSSVLVSQPDSFSRLKSGKEYPLKDFLKRLAKETPVGNFGE